MSVLEYRACAPVSFGLLKLQKALMALSLDLLAIFVIAK